MPLLGVATVFDDGRRSLPAFPRRWSQQTRALGEVGCSETAENVMAGGVRKKQRLLENWQCRRSHRLARRPQSLVCV